MKQPARSRAGWRKKGEGSGDYFDSLPSSRVFGTENSTGVVGREMVCIGKTSRRSTFLVRLGIGSFWASSALGILGLVEGAAGVTVTLSQVSQQSLHRQRPNSRLSNPAGLQPQELSHDHLQLVL